MAAYVPPPSPGDLRSPRKQALEMGTIRSGFEAGRAPDLEAPRVQLLGPQISYQGGSINPATPFTVKK